MGHKVTIFERLPEIGGMLRYGIPDYRLPKNILNQEVERIKKMGVVIKTNQTLGKDFTINSLIKDGFSAIFLAIGAHQNQRLNIRGEDLKGVLSGIDFLRAIASREPVKIGKQIAVIGGGNTAFDSARSALRLGVQKVTIIYRRSRAEMPAIECEIEEAEEEGIEILFLSTPVRIIEKNGRVNGIECTKMSLGEPDASGRPRPKPISGSEFTLMVDTVITAIGQRPDLSFLSEEKDLRIERGKIVVDSETLQTNIKGVFAGGDCVTGSATAVEAIAMGKKAAASISHYLKGEKKVADRKLFSISKGQLADLAGREEFVQAERKPRRKMPQLRPNERRSNFQEIKLGYTEDIARKEAERCLECGCKIAYDCTLRKLADEYKLSPVSDKNKRYYPLDKSHPFIERDSNKCIGCTRCVKICSEIQGIGAIGFAHRILTPPYGKSLLETDCESCGQCITTCPTGALVFNKGMQPAREVATICPYCGCGCGIYLGIRGNIIVNVRGDSHNPVNQGKLCAKGRFGYDFVNHPKRLTSPLIKQNGEFVKVPWEKALDFVVNKLINYKGDQFATIASAKCTNEENYLLQKFTRVVMKTNNIDHCARLCHAPSVAGLAQSFGSGAMTNSIREISDSACIFAIGTNTTVAHPIIGLQIKKAVQNGAKLIIANPKKIDLCRFAELWLRHRPGSDVALLMGMIKVIVDEGLLDLSFIEKRCENFDNFKKSLPNFDLSSVEKLTGVDREDIAKAARLYATCKPATILYSMGITQHSHGTDNVLAISNLALLTGNIGKPSTGVNPLRGQNNVQGACDLGALPNVYPGYQKVIEPEVRKKFEVAWGGTLNTSPGLTHVEIFEAIRQGKIKALYLVGENPVLSEANAQHVIEALRQLDFLVVQDIFLSETAKFADVVLPAASFAEKDGTFTNTERRIQRIYKAIEPVGEAKPDWWIVCKLAQKMKAKGFDFSHPAEIMEEIASLTPSYQGISYDRLKKGGLQWPCPNKEHPGTPYLHRQQFATKSGRAKFVPLEYRPPAEEVDDEYPLILTTERSLYHFHTATMSRKVEGLNTLKPEETVEINPADARTLNIASGEQVQIISRRGKITARAKLTNASPPGVVAMSFHFAESPTNLLTNSALDPLAKIPETKVCAVRIEKS
jgi:formate dehydrogenase major subunit